jgi:hypothetical protein
LAWATALTGGDASIDCHNPQGLAGTAQAFTERLSQDYGAGRYLVEVLDVDGDRTTVSIAALDGTDAAAHSVREWAVATASTTGVIESSGYGAVWINGEGRSTQDVSSAAIAPIQVVIATG